MKDYFDWDFLNRDFSEDRRQELASSGEAMPDGSFPIVTREDLANAIQAIGRAKDPEAVKRHIVKRARALGAEEMIPEGWSGQSDWSPRKPKALLKKGDWYRIENRADAPSEVYIYDEIGGYGVSSGDFLGELRALDGDVTLHLNSPGGDVFDGLTIYQALKSHAGTTTVVVDGLAASIASVIAMGADHLVMAPKATMMIHEGWTAAVGNSADMRKLADLLDKTSSTIASVYADRAGGTVEFWRDRMRDETWYSADEALEAGLIDEVQGKAAKRAGFDLSMYAHAGRDSAPAPVLKDAAPVTPAAGKKEDDPAPFVWDLTGLKSALQEGVN